jgi:putative acetyltransferase
VNSLIPIYKADIALVNESSEALLDLIADSNRLLTSLYPSESNHLESPGALFRQNVCLYGATIDAELVGIGAVKLLQDDQGPYGEIKRVFVSTRHRGKGIAIEIMDYLEHFLADQQISISRLETGVRQPEAIALYQKLGYMEIPPFGNYIEDPHSMFMEKHLVAENRA